MLSVYDVCHVFVLYASEMRFVFCLQMPLITYIFCSCVDVSQFCKLFVTCSNIMLHHIINNRIQNKNQEPSTKRKDIIKIVTFDMQKNTNTYLRCQYLVQDIILHVPCCFLIWYHHLVSKYHHYYNHCRKCVKNDTKT